MKSETTEHLTARPAGRSASVRGLLLDVAERLFAEHGIEAVSFNQIAKAADQRNSTVIQYHFGSKTGLLEAILERHMPAVNDLRLQMLKRIDGKNRLVDLRRLAEAMVIPYAAHLSHENGTYFVRLSAQFYSDPRLELFKLMKGKYNTSWREAGRITREILPELPAFVVKHRLGLLTSLVFAAFADRERLRAAGKHVGVARLHTEPFVNDLVTMIVAALNAPYGGSSEIDEEDSRATATITSGK
jgi:AcrR family transcriptional regulator